MMHIRLATDEDVSPPAGTSSLDGLAEMLGQISSQLDGACDELQRVAARSLRTNGLPAVTSQPSMQMDVRRARSLRGLRKRLLGDQYFTGPPWEILLYLFDSHLRQLRDSVGNVSDGTEIPPSTTLRWLERLEAAKLITVRDDPLDARRRFVEISPCAVDVMNKYFLGATTHLIAA